jgi:hypothetical protein
MQSATPPQIGSNYLARAHCLLKGPWLSIRSFEGFTVIISHAHRFILLAPWKCASSTCHESLAEFDESPYDRFFHFNAQLNRVLHQHLTLGYLRALPEAQLGYKTAAFVRNPYDRAYSGFLQLQRDFSVQPALDYQPGWIGNLVRDQIAVNMGRIICAGFDFDRWIQLLPEHEVYDASRNTNMPLHPAHYWTHLAGKRHVDFVGRVESFTQDFEAFSRFVGIEPPPIKIANSSDQGGSPSSGSKYAGRMSRRSLDRINELFHADFEYFGYEKL